MENSPVELIDSRGKKRKATVILSRFIEKEVDMALIQLNVDETPFESFIGVRREAVKLGQQLALVGLATNSRDETTIYFSVCQVVLIDACAIFHSICYTAHDSLSASSLHGHTAACLICEVARVPDILSALDDVAESKADEEKLIS